MAEYEIKESEYVSGKEIKDMTGVTFELLDEVKDAPSDFGVKPKCSVNVAMGTVTVRKMWTLNQQNVNFFVKEFGANSTTWVGKKVEVFTEVIKGNVSIRVKGVAVQLVFTQHTYNKMSEEDFLKSSDKPLILQGEEKKDD